MTDPFTDEDVRKAKDAYNDVTRDILVTHTDGIKSALLAGTERLRAQGTWNEAIEAAAKVADSAAWGNKNTQYLGPEQNCVRVAGAIRALARKETP